MTNILVETKDKIGFININRTEVKNALNLQTINELIAAFTEMDANNAIHCVILGSQSREAFCSGADLKEFSQKKDIKEKTDYFDALSGLILAIKNSPKTIITKVHGYALAGGLALVAAADIVLAANDAKFALPELKVGMVPGVVMLALEEVINKRALNYMSLSGDVMDADEAFQIGLVSKIFSETVLDKKALELAEEISNFSKDALATTKKMLQSGSTLDKKLKHRSAEMAAYSLTPACVEGTEAYLNKRKPNWP